MCWWEQVIANYIGFGKKMNFSVLQISHAHVNERMC